MLNLHFHTGAGSSTTQMPNCHCFDEKSVLVKELTRPVFSTLLSFAFVTA